MTTRLFTNMSSRFFSRTARTFGLLPIVFFSSQIRAENYFQKGWTRAITDGIGYGQYAGRYENRQPITIVSDVNVKTGNSQLFPFESVTKLPKYRKFTPATIVYPEVSVRGEVVGKYEDLVSYTVVYGIYPDYSIRPKPKKSGKWVYTQKEQRSPVETLVIFQIKLIDNPEQYCVVCDSDRILARNLLREDPKQEVKVMSCAEVINKYGITSVDQWKLIKEPRFKW